MFGWATPPELVRKGIPLSGCICCRDDIMNYLILQGVKPKLSFKTMESVRKGKGLTEEMEAAMNEQNVPEWYIDSCKKIKYMFPKAHAVAYVMMAFRIAWFKVHRPLAFYSAYFSVRAKGFDAPCTDKGRQGVSGQDRGAENEGPRQDHLRRKGYDDDARGLPRVLPPRFRFRADGHLHLGRDALPRDGYRTDPAVYVHAGASASRQAQSIVEERQNGKFLSAEEMAVRCPKASKAVVELLDQIGALGSMPKTTQVFSLFG